MGSIFGSCGANLSCCDIQHETEGQGRSFVMQTVGIVVATRPIGQHGPTQGTLPFMHAFLFVSINNKRAKKGANGVVEGHR